MITELEVENFKSLRDVDIEFDNLTVFVGKNNSGKSAAMESLVYFQEAIKNNISSASSFPEHLTCVGYDFNETDELFFRNSDFQADEVAVSPTFDFSGSTSGKNLEQELEKANVPTDPLELKVTAQLDDDGVSETVECGSGSTGQVVFRVEEGYPEQSRELITPYSTDNRGYQNGLFDYSEFSNADEKDLFNNIKQSLEECLENTFYIADGRDVQSWDDDPMERDFVGHHGEHTVSMLHALRDDEEAFSRVVEAMADIADDTEGVVADMHESQTQTELVDADTGELFNIVSSGAGLRRILPIIVQVASTKSGGTVLIEEPEIGVYPKTQQGLVDFITTQIEERDIQVVMSTHSATMVWKLQDRVDSGEGKAYEFEKEDGKTSAREVDLNYVTSTFEDFYGAS